MGCNVALMESAAMSIPNKVRSAAISAYRLSMTRGIHQSASGEFHCSVDLDDVRVEHMGLGQVWRVLIAQSWINF